MVNRIRGEEDRYPQPLLSPSPAGIAAIKKQASAGGIRYSIWLSQEPTENSCLQVLALGLALQMVSYLFSLILRGENILKEEVKINKK